MTEKIRVLHVIDKFTMDGVNPSSCSRLFADWIPLHDSSRFQVDVVGLRPRDAAGAFLEKQGITVHYIQEGKFSPKNITAIADLAARGDYDILHLHGYSSANFGRLAARKIGIRSIVHEHAILPVQPHQYVADWLLRNRTDVAVAVSNAVKAFMIHGRSIPEEKIEVIWNGIDLEHFQNVPAERVQHFREQHGLPETGTIIGTVTRLREEKGNAYLLEAAAEVLRHEPEVTFVLIGDGPLRDTLQQQARDLGIAEKVLFTGFVSDIQAALAALDIVVIPSLREGFGLALVEAMAAGKPVVATKVGGMIELARHERSALMVYEADSPALAQAILRLLQEPELAQQLADQAREDSGRFSIGENVRSLEALYERLVPAKSGVTA